MADEQEQSQKTEEPTRKKLDDAIKKGQVASSREIANFLILLLFTLLLVWVAPGAMEETRVALTRFVTRPDAIPVDRQSMKPLMQSLVSDAGAVMLPIMLGTVIAALVSGLLQNGIIFSASPLKPKLEKISPLKGLKRMFSLRSVVEFLKGLLKITIVGGIAYMAVSPAMPQLRLLPGYDEALLLGMIGELAVRMLIGVCCIMFVIALLDFSYQRFEYIKNLRMTKQEVKEEHKQQEGDPLIKQRLRQIRLERARRRMMAAVPKADVVITNPTHFAVALEYKAENMKAPVVVAKGADKIALKIREVAKEHDVPIVENPPLARTLFDTTDLDKEIPYEHYQAVAEIISYVYRLKGKML